MVCLLRNVLLLVQGLPRDPCWYLQGPMELHGLADKVDVMIEAKCKERALIRFRNSMKEGPSADAQMALKFL